MDKHLEKQDYKEVIKQMYANHYFTNHGPLATNLETELENWTGFDQVVAVGSELISLLIAIVGTVGEGLLVVPQGTPDHFENILNLSRINYLVREKSSDQHLSSKNYSVFNKASNVYMYESLSDENEDLYKQTYDENENKKIIYTKEALVPGVGSKLGDNLVLVLSLSDALNTKSDLYSGIICTNNNYLSHIFRNIRSSYGVEETVSVIASCNGRISEGQAGLGLRFLKSIIHNIDR